MNTESSTEQKNSRLKRIWSMLPSIFLILLIIIIVAMFSGIKSKSERINAEKLKALNEERPPLNVVVLNVDPMPIYDRINLPAQVEPWIELNILAEVSGKVTKLLAVEGDHVNKGNLIAIIDPRDYENELAAVRAEYELAEKNLARTKDLFGEKLITRAQFDRDTSIVNKMAAAVKNAELRLERCSIKAPITGIINRLQAKEGLYLNVQDPVAVMLDIGKVKVSVGIPESDVDAVRGLMDFDITIDALGEKTIRGTKHFLSKSPESFAHLYKLEIEVPNSGGELLPGMFARVDIIKEQIKDSISVPLYSVINRVNEKFVYIVNDEKAHVRMVETGILDGWKIQISKGLSEGDRVIVVGHRSVDEGQNVNVVRSLSNPEELFQ